MEIKLDHERARELQRHQGDVVEIRRRARQWRLTDCDVTALTRMRRALMQEMEQQEVRLNEADDHFLMFVENGRPLETEEVRQRIESLSNEWESMNSHLKQVDDAILERQLRQRMVRLMGSELGANLWEAIVFILILFIVVLTIVELLVPLSVDTIRWILTIDTIGCFLLLGENRIVHLFQMAIFSCGSLYRMISGGISDATGSILWPRFPLRRHSIWGASCGLPALPVFYACCDWGALCACCCLLFGD